MLKLQMLKIDCVAKLKTTGAKCNYAKINLLNLSQNGDAKREVQICKI